MLSNIEDRIVTLISTTSKVPKEEIKPECSFEELDIDSLVLVELSFKLRKEFGITDEIDQELDEVQTVDEVFALVKKSQTQRSVA